MHTNWYRFAVVLVCPAGIVPVITHAHTHTETFISLASQLHCTTAFYSLWYYCNCLF